MRQSQKHELATMLEFTLFLLKETTRNRDTQETVAIKDGQEILVSDVAHMAGRLQAKIRTLRGE